ncbi:hypothetical protein [Undibacterium danionis]|uniref:Uncharacterized protein n=1 Tax=Undibacterium danionis TaxID=1812100 RepID=A0ABV6IA49_9BURK
MKIENKSESGITIFFTLDELYILNNSLNEVCNGLPLRDFENRMGATIAEAEELFSQINRIL